MSTDQELATDQPVLVRAIQARNFRCLRHVDLRLDGSFYALVGPNGSGKSTLLDAIMFVSDLFESGPECAVAKRTQNFQDLVWARPDDTLAFELAVEFDIADQALRYEVRVEETSDGIEIVREHAYLAHLSDAQFTYTATSTPGWSLGRGRWTTRCSGPQTYSREGPVRADRRCRYRGGGRDAYVHDHRYALVMFDRDGSGDDRERQVIEAAVEHDLERSGWQSRSKAIVIEPELEAWVWTSSPHTAKALGWERHDALRTRLRDTGDWPAGEAKPPDPKTALASPMRVHNRRPTADVFSHLARRVGLARCQDPAFLDFRRTLQRWFPRPPQG